MHINVSSEQHTQSIKQLLRSINSNPESVKELSGWGLEIGLQLLMVRLYCCCQSQVRSKFQFLFSAVFLHAKFS